MYCCPCLRLRAHLASRDDISRFRLDEPDSREKIKATLLLCKCYTKVCFVRKLFFGVLLSRVFLYCNNIQLRVKQNILWIKWITSSGVNRFIVKSLTYYPIIIRFASLLLNSGIYTLSHEIGLFCKICKRSDVTLEFNWI